MAEGEANQNGGRRKEHARNLEGLAPLPVSGGGAALEDNDRRAGFVPYGALIAEDNNSMSWGMYMSGDCKNIISFAGGSVVTEFGGVMYALTLDDDTPLE